jgi:integrase
MPQQSLLPSYRKHKQSGNAIVTFRLPGGRRKDYVLGCYGSNESKAEYARLLGEFEAGHGTLPGPSGPTGDITINELLVRYLRHCDQYYRSLDGTPTRQAESVRDATRPLMHAYGHTTVRNFGPLALKAVRALMIEAGNARKTINQRIGMIRQFFKWCVAEELVPPSVLEGLRAVAGLQPGRTAAPDRRPVRPADPNEVEAAIVFMSPQIAALVRLQLLSGARGGELLGIRAADIDRSGSVWVYRPAQHKNAWRARPREILFGPKAQEVLLPWLETKADGPLFSPKETQAEWNALRSERRKTPKFPSHMRHNAIRKAKHRRRPPADQYTSCSYRRAIERACVRAFPLPAHLQKKWIKTATGESRAETSDEWQEGLGSADVAAARAWREAHIWSPHRLRHTAGTTIRRTFGIELARIILGHSSAFTTEVYAEVDRDQARDVVAKIG